ncbi:MAG: LLM class flavin-dependent oxidoreductase [Chloroflexota bacterium]|nr:LLM class flavin-dependent oxidoreductase [Chloroflexota bacterium]MDE3193831.1 LLM class flavin-dependent oxidoreductase [Chloroflexota bacterium]
MGERLGFAFDAALGPAVSAAVAPEVERLGYASLWTNDTPNAPGLPVLAAAQRPTARVALGVGVIACDRRSSREIASAVSELELDARRAVIGIGSGRAEHPVDAVRTAMGELRRILDPDVAVAVAAMGPRMCRLAGEIADIVLLNWMTPERIRWARERVREGERRAGREPGSVVVASYVRVAVGRDARERLADAAGRYARSPAYARSFAAMGVEPGTVGVAAASPDDARAALAPYRDALDETIVRALPVFPTADSVLELARGTRP